MKIIVLIGKKIGMTRIFNNIGISLPITVLNFNDNIITSIKKVGDLYKTQIKFGYKKKANKCEYGFYNKIGLKPGIKLLEIPYIKEIHLNVGQNLNVSLFKNINKVDVIGISKGKGFSGTIKRWNFKSQDKSHGNSLSHRAPGSIGQNQSPGRVLKGKKMPGQLGNKKITLQGLKIIKILKKDNIMLIKGCIPGFNNSNLIVKSSIK